MASMLFGGAGVEHQKKYGTKNETFAKIAVKARKHGEHNERAIFRNLGDTRGSVGFAANRPRR